MLKNLYINICKRKIQHCILCDVLYIEVKDYIFYQCVNQDDGIL